MVTPRSYAFADAAELFFFLSGFVAAMVYGRIAGREGAVAATRKIWRRAFVLYGAQLLLFAFVLAEISLAVAATGHAIHQRHFRFDAMLTEPGAALTHAILLRYQPAYLDILPLYVLFLAAFPLVLMGLARNLWLVLVPSAALWPGVQIWAVTLPPYPSGGGWFFNPLAWPFLFVLGAAPGHPPPPGGRRGRKGPRHGPPTRHSGSAAQDARPGRKRSRDASVQLGRWRAGRAGPALGAIQAARG